MAPVGHHHLVAEASLPLPGGDKLDFPGAVLTSADIDDLGVEGVPEPELLDLVAEARVDLVVTGAARVVRGHRKSEKANRGHEVLICKVS